MLNPAYLILPVLTAVLFFGDYRISTMDNESDSQERALKEAGWWSAIFFLVGISNLAMFGRYL